MEQNQLVIKLKSWKGDYLCRIEGEPRVTTCDVEHRNEWAVETVENELMWKPEELKKLTATSKKIKELNKIKLRSWMGDYLHRPDEEPRVTTWPVRVCNEWAVETMSDGKVKLKSWKGDYLCRLDGEPRVTTCDVENGNEWSVEIVERDLSWMPQELTTAINTNFKNELSTDESENIKIEKNWWGITFIMDEKLTRDIIDGVEGVGALSEVIISLLAGASVITGGAAAIVGIALATIFVAKVLEMEIADNGNGVRWYTSWLQWGIVFVPIPLPDLVSMTAKGMLVMHPTRN